MIRLCCCSRFVRALDETHQVRDFSESALVTWDPESLRHTRRLEADGCYFSEYQNGKQVPIPAGLMEQTGRIAVSIP